MNKKDYQNYLQDPQWLLRRNQILTRDKNTCQFCGAQDRVLHVHHKYYIEGLKPWEYDDEALISLCKRCHESVTTDKDDLYYLFLQVRDLFRSSGFSDAIFNTILCHFSSFLEFYGTEMQYDNEMVLNFIDSAVCSSQNYEDFKVLTKFGIKHTDFVKNQYPMFAGQYEKL